MRTIFKYLVVCILLLTGVKSYSQVVGLNIVNQEDLDLFYSNIRNSNSNAINYDEIEGSPYYSDDFTLADIYFKDGKVIKQEGIRLNLHRKTLEFIRNGEVLEMTEMEGLDQVITNADQFVYINQARAPEDIGFYKIITNGEFQLLQLLKVTYFDATKAANSYEDDTPAEFKKQTGNYYLGSESNLPLAFGNKRNFKKTFTNEYPELVKYANAAKLNPAKYNDLVKMVEFLNSL